MYAPFSIEFLPCIASSRGFFDICWRAQALKIRSKCSFGTGTVGVEDLLSHPLLWRGQDSSAELPAIATGFAALDQYLPGGGWPLSGISEIFIERYGLGELSLLMPALAALSDQAAEAKKWIVWVAPPFVPYAPALADHGVDLSRILLVHPAGDGRDKRVYGRTLPRETFSRKKGGDSEDALWAVEQAIRSQSSVATLAWVKQADVTALRRLQLSAEAFHCWTVLFRPIQAMGQNSPAILRFKLSSDADRPGKRIEIQKCRGRKPRTLFL